MENQKLEYSKVAVLGFKIYPYVGDASNLKMYDIVDVTKSYKEWNNCSDIKDQIKIAQENYGIVKDIFDMDNEKIAMFYPYHYTD